MVKGVILLSALFLGNAVLWEYFSQTGRKRTANLIHNLTSVLGFLVVFGLFLTLLVNVKYLL